MRLVANDPDILNFHCDVYLDGVKQMAVTMADEEWGMIRRHKREDGNGERFAYSPKYGMAIEEHVKGVVEIRLQDDAPPEAREEYARRRAIVPKQRRPDGW